MYRIIMYLKRRGFTLAEVLVATVIAGYCIMPIVGSMQGGIRHTENFNHREKLRMLARSRLNKELSAGAFDHKSINFNPDYHYIYRLDDNPNYLSFNSPLDPSNPSLIIPDGSATDTIVYTYYTSVEVKEDIDIATTTTGLAINSEILNPRSLKALLVRSELLDGPYVIATDSISYFSLISVPSFDERYLWAANSSMLQISAIDPTTRSVIETYDLPLVSTSNLKTHAIQNPNRPWNIDVHPTQKIIGIQCAGTIRLLNIDKSHANYRASEVVENHPAAGQFAFVSETNPINAEGDRGIVFRPDGKYFFVTSHSNKFLYVYKIDVATGTMAWPPPTTLVTGVALTETDLNSDVFSDLVAGNDGYLYLSVKAKNTVIRFPMYPSSFTTDWTYEKIINPTQAATSVNSVLTSGDGKHLYFGTIINRVAQFHSNPLSRTGTALFTFISGTGVADTIISPDSKYLMMTDTFAATNKGGLCVATISNIIFSNTGIPNIPTYQSYPKNITADQAITSPVGNIAMFTNDSDSEMYFVDIASLAAGTYHSSMPADRFLDYDTSSSKPPSDMVGRQGNYMIVGTGNDDTDSTIEYFDLDALKFDRVKSIPDLRQRPSTIAINPQGTRFKVGYGDDSANATAGLDTFDLINNSLTTPLNVGLTGHSARVTYSSDDDTLNEYYGTPNMDSFFASLETVTQNGYYIPNAPIPGGLPNNQCRDVDLVADWEPKDLVSMANGGFLLLFKKADGSAMLDWIGKIKWGTDKFKYQRFARWISTVDDNFPPRHAQNIALSPDEKYLAIECATTTNKVYLYDFATNNFGHETQLRGWAVDYRVGNGTSWIFDNVAGLCNFKVVNPTTATGIKLKDCISSRDNWTNYNSYPGNFGNDSSVVGENLATKAAANRRFFGYFQPDYDAAKFAVFNRDGTRWFYNSTFVDSRNDTGSDDLLPNPLIANQTALTTSLIQLDYVTNGGDIMQGVFTNTSAAAVPPAATSSGSDQNSILDMAGWTKIGSESTRPFNFQPVFLRSYDLVGCTNDPDSALTFSRDLANPILFQFDTVQDDIWALKPGKSFTRIDVGESLSVADKHLVVSPDGQKLIFAEESGSNRIFVTDISNPDSFLFDGVVANQGTLTGFGKLITTVSNTNPLRALATKPFNTIKSTNHLGKYEQLATFTVKIMGNNNAALASGGIYIMGGAPSASGVPINNIFQFNPASPTSIVGSLSTTLNLSVKNNSVVAYDKMIYSLNGASGTVVASACDWVQRFSPIDSSVLSSADDLLSNPNVAPLASSADVYTDCYATYGGITVTSSHDEGAGASPSSNDSLPNLFDGSTRVWESDDPLNYATNPPWIKLDLGLGNEKTVDTLKFTTSSSKGLINFKFQGSNIVAHSNASDSLDWTTLCTSSGNAGSAEQSFALSPTGSYRYYRLVCLSGNGSEIAISSLKLIDSLAASVAAAGAGAVPVMTKTTTDSRVNIKLSNTAACMTPYGIVSAGGQDTSGAASRTALVYWPHALDKHTPASLPAPVAWYKLNEGSGLTAADYVGGFTGTVVSPTWVPGKIQNGLQLNGTSSYVSASRPVQNDFTISCWIKTTSAGNGLPHYETRAIVHSEASGVNNDFGFGIDSNGMLTYGDGKSGFGDMHLRTAIAINDGKWRHVAVTRVKLTGAVKLYIDGVLSISGNCNVNNTLNSSANITIGYANDAGALRYLDGTLDDVRFYDVALTESEISGVMLGDYFSTGISREIPPMNTAVFGHSLVWHKGKMYRIGGYTAGTATATNINIFDFDTNGWTSVAHNVASFTNIDGNTVTFGQPAYAGICSFGDEIFVFGGLANGGTFLNTAFAWNPETSVVRKLNNMPAPRAYFSAVPCGSSIYLLGGGSSAVPALNSPIHKFTP